MQLINIFVKNNYHQHPSCEAAHRQRQGQRGTSGEDEGQAREPPGLASPAWPQPRLPLGQSCYASLPFKQMRKCSSSLPNDLFGPEPRQVSFQPTRPSVPPTQLVPSSQAFQGHPVFRVPESFQSHNHLGHQKELTSCSQKYPSPFNNLLTKGCLGAPVQNTPMLWRRGSWVAEGYALKGACGKSYVSKQVEGPWVIWVGCFPFSWCWEGKGELDIFSPNPLRGSIPASMHLSSVDLLWSQG